MINKWTGFLAFLVAALVIAGCGKSKESLQSKSIVVVAAEGDVDSFNPLFAQESIAGEINDLLYPALVGSDFDTVRGTLVYTPLLATSWEFQDNHRDLLFHLNTAAKWSDGVRVVARDVQFSYELYADPEVASVRQANVEGLRRTEGKLDITRCVVVVDDSTVIFHFARPSPAQLFDAGLPILPSHVLAGVPHKDLRTHSLNKSPVGSGPFSLERWTPLQEIDLTSSEASMLPFPARLNRLVFRILPDYRSRVMQLKAGEVDVVTALRKEDADDILQQSPDLELVAIPGRDYDFIGWNNIDPVAYAASQGTSIKAHPLFGSARVRRALTLAVNREEITRAYLGRYGHEALGGVSPLFKWAQNDTLKPLPYDPAMSRILLDGEGWNVGKGIGVREKRGRPFSFTMMIPSGNQLRTVVASVIQQQLRAVGIEVKISQVEPATFWEDLIERKYDAWLAGFSVPLQMQLDELWGSDLKRYPFNLTGFRNARVDQILATARTLTEEKDGAPLWKEFQSIIHNEQPCTFLYWIDNVVGVNKRVRGMHIGVSGTTHKAWEWNIAR